MPLYRPGLNADAVSHVTATEAFGVGIEYFIVNSGGRYAKFVSGADYRREIAAEQHEVIRICRFPEKGNHGVFHVPKIYPLESGVMKIHFIERSILNIEPVQLAYENL